MEEYTLSSLTAKFLTFLPSLIASLVIFIAGLIISTLASQIVRRALRKRGSSPEMIVWLSRITYWSLFSMFTISALQQIGFNVTAFLASLGILGFTVGFALQDISKNVVAGLILLLQKSFSVGHTIGYEEFTGEILSIDMRSITIQTVDGRIAYIPNSNIFTTTIINYSQATKRRITLEAGIPYDVDIDAANKTILETLKTIPGALGDPPPEVNFHTFGKDKIGMTIHYWIDPKKSSLLTAQDNGIKAIKTAFQKLDIHVPNPPHSLLDTIQQS